MSSDNESADVESLERMLARRQARLSELEADALKMMKILERVQRYLISRTIPANGETAEAVLKAVNEVLKEASPKIEYCIPGDTKVKLADGSTKSIKDLYEHHGGYEWFWAYSFCEDRDRRVINVELYNGKRVVASPNHSFELLSGRRKRADELVAEDKVFLSGEPAVVTSVTELLEKTKTKIADRNFEQSHKPTDIGSLIRALFEAQTDRDAAMSARDAAEAKAKDVGKILSDAIDRLKDYEKERAIVLNEKCPSDEKHCSCVPTLRKRIRDLEKSIRKIQSEFELVLRGDEQ